MLQLMKYFVSVQHPIICTVLKNPILVLMSIYMMAHFVCNIWIVYKVKNHMEDNVIE